MINENHWTPNRMNDIAMRQLASIHAHVADSLLPAAKDLAVNRSQLFGQPASIVRENRPPRQIATPTPQIIGEPAQDPLRNFVLLKHLEFFPITPDFKVTSEVDGGVVATRSAT